MGQKLDRGEIRAFSLDGETICFNKTATGIISHNAHRWYDMPREENARYNSEKQAALQEITNAIEIKDLASIIHGYAYGILPIDLPKSKKAVIQQTSCLPSHCSIQ